MFDKLASVETRYEELMASLGTSTVQNDPTEYRKQAKMLSDIEALVLKYREYKVVSSELAQAEELMKSSGDPEMRDLAQEELSDLNAQRGRIIDELKILLIPKDPNDDKNVLVEIRAGTGGEEAALFASELYRMYTRYAERQGWKLEILNMSEAGQGGLQGSHRQHHRQGRLQPPEVRKRRAPRAARPGHRSLGAHPHLHGDRGGAAGSR